MRYSKSFYGGNLPGPPYTLWRDEPETEEDFCLADFYEESDLDLVLKGLEMQGYKIDWSRPWAEE